MNIEKAILAVITMNQAKISGSVATFICETKEELDDKAANLEAILDGISHQLSEDIYIIVKH